MDVQYFSFKNLNDIKFFSIYKLFVLYQFHRILRLQ